MKLFENMCYFENKSAIGIALNLSPPSNDVIITLFL